LIFSEKTLFLAINIGGK